MSTIFAFGGFLVQNRVQFGLGVFAYETFVRSMKDHVLFVAARGLAAVRTINGVAYESRGEKRIGTAELNWRVENSLAIEATNLAARHYKYEITTKILANYFIFRNSFHAWTSSWIAAASGTLLVQSAHRAYAWL